MSSVEYTTKCPRCGEPDAYAYSGVRTYEEVLSCHRCGLYKSNILVPEFWDLSVEDHYNVDIKDEKWWIRTDEISQVGGATVNSMKGKEWSFIFKTQDELESFKLGYQKEIIKPNSRIKVGQNFLYQFVEKEVVFRVTDLDTLTTKDYLPEDYFKAFPLDYGDR
jgi:hypothetical protein